MRKYSVALVPGDGVGVKITSAVAPVLEQLAELHGFGLIWREYDWGYNYYLQHGIMMPENALDELSRSDAILLGAVGAPAVPDHVSLWGMLIPIRRGFNQYVNFRPVRTFRGMHAHRGLKRPIDLVIVRENSEGEYSNVGGRTTTASGEELAIQEAVFSRFGVERIVRFACRQARARDGILTCATKSNGITFTMPFWDEVAKEVAEVEGIVLEYEHIDALAARLVLEPESVSTIVALNLFGDILSDLAAALTGGIGMGPSANLNPPGDYPSMFEPIHGSAPDIAGLGVANPVGQLWAASLMFAELGEEAASERLFEAIEETLAIPGLHTRDLGGQATTSELCGGLQGLL